MSQYCIVSMSYLEVTTSFWIVLYGFRLWVTCCVKNLHSKVSQTVLLSKSLRVRFRSHKNSNLYAHFFLCNKQNANYESYLLRTWYVIFVYLPHRQFRPQKLSQGDFFLEIVVYHNSQNLKHNWCLHVVQIGSGSNPASYPMSTGGSFPEVKGPGRETDHSPPISAEVKKTWIYTSTPQYAFMA
jgi:hypothetical protein